MPCLLKRKRSESEFSFSSSTTLSSPTRPDGSKAWSGLAVDGTVPTSASRLGSVPLHLSSRTFKRCRSNRPSDAEVHQHTLDLLYSAQQQPTIPQFFPSMPPSSAEPHNFATTAAHQQSSLHNYWHIPSPVPQNSAAPTAPAIARAAPTRQISAQSSPMCEDCGAAVGCDGDLCMMDVDDDAIGNHERCCCVCRKVVCFSCSISNLGEQRRCLPCAGRKVWIGGIGWTVQ